MTRPLSGRCIVRLLRHLQLVAEHLLRSVPVRLSPCAAIQREDVYKRQRLRYVVARESGPDHDKHFEVDVYLNSNAVGHGEGHSKKQAEQAAAKEALALMGY